MIPETVDEFISTATDFSDTLRAVKASDPKEPWLWYPYDSLATIRHLEPILRRNWERMRDALGAGPLIDIGCADGDIAYLFASLGCEVCAVDFPPTNVNSMDGVREIRRRMGYTNVEIREIDLDRQFSIQEDDWGMALVLGILYHLKNPFQVLEHLAFRARYCLLSTRVARKTMTGLDIQNEPVAYLLDHREANNDPTNYWIFSECGLLRMVRRAGWRTVGALTLGSTESNPVEGSADERMFLLLRSQYRSLPARIRLLEGWTDPLVQQWRWTLKKFSFEARIIDEARPHGFLLGFLLPPSIIEAGEMTLRCAVNGIACPERTFNKQGDHLYEAELPESVDHRMPIHFSFEAVHNAKFPPDPRDLGVIMSSSGAIRGVSEKILFWLD